MVSREVKQGMRFSAAAADVKTVSKGRVRARRGVNHPADGAVYNKVYHVGVASSASC